MADTVTPTSGNPYLALLQQEQGPPSLAQILQHIGNLGFGLAGGFGQAASGGLPTMAGIGPGLMMGNQLNAQAAQQAEQARQKRAEIGIQASEWDLKRAKEQREQAAIDAYAKQSPLGFNATQSTGPLMGPNVNAQPSAAQPGPDLKTAGAPLVDYLVAQHGLSPLAASTLVGNLGWESPGFNTSQRHDGGRGFGLAGWDPSRTAGLQTFAAAAGKPVTDLQTQLDYAVHEMKSGKDMGAARSWAMLQQAKTPEQANAAIMHFFRPQGYTPANPTGGHGFGGRVANTRALLPQDRPSDPATAPVPTVDPYAVAAPPPGPAPRPGLGPRATPPGPDGPQGPVAPGGSPIDPNAQPPPFVAQGGGEGEVVLPRIGLPFPAQAPAPAPPGSVPFPAVPGQPAPAGPNVVQPNYNPPQPGQPTMAPAGGPAPGDQTPPPVRVRRPPVTLPPELNDRINAGVAARVYTPQQADTLKHQLVTEEQRRRDAEDDAQYAAAMDVYRQQQEGGRFERAEKAKRDAEERAQTRQLEAEQRRAAEENKKHERDVADRQKAREDAARQAGDKQTFEQTKFATETENKMRDDFNGIKQVQDFRKADLVFQSAQKAARTNTPAADLNLVYAFATMMDPGSVVRDQETGMIRATQSASDQVKAYVAMVTGDSRLSPKAKKELLAEMATRHSAYKESHDAFATAFEEMSTKRGLDPKNVVTRVVVEKEKEDEPSGTTGTQPPAAGALPQPKTKADFDKLPKGTLFLDPQGNERRKP